MEDVSPHTCAYVGDGHKNLWKGQEEKEIIMKLQLVQLLVFSWGIRKQLRRWKQRDGQTYPGSHS